MLSAGSVGTSSMVAAICYAWLLENRMRASKKEDEEDECVVVPVMNARRGSMWKLQQAAWLFRHVSIDATALLFSDEVILFLLCFAIFGLSICYIDVEAHRNELDPRCHR